jgi:hypothetical protein
VQREEMMMGKKSSFLFLSFSLGKKKKKILSTALYVRVRFIVASP